MKSNFLVAMEVFNACVNLNALEDQNKYVWTTLQTIKNGWDLDLFVGCNLFNFYAKFSTKKMWQNDYPFSYIQKLIFGWRNTTFLSLFSTLILKVKWIFFVPLYVHERECARRRYKTKILQNFQPLANYKWLNIVVFPHFLRCQALFL